jgi:hypothetical protein
VDNVDDLVSYKISLYGGNSGWHSCIIAVVLKVFHVKDPHIDIRLLACALAVILNHFNFKDPHFDMHWADPPFNGIYISETAIVKCRSMSNRLREFGS